ncbi:MAG TPA: cyclopropane-fatty-acyl-phospholipid synthase family protein [Opitutaceae bacterium]|nr:cyclopropane-fatty-acyl-phospholipid synthase family protein [Opitutaceae bacterium]
MSSTATSTRLTARLAPSTSPSLARRAVLGAFAAMTRGSLRLDLPDGSACEFGASRDAPGIALPGGISSAARVHVRREAFFQKCFWSGDIGFAESFVDGDWDSPDLAAVVAFFILNVENAPTLSGSRRASPLALNLLRFAHRLAHRLRPNTRAIARRNIREHYDLSNEFFALWLDPSLMYSSALWPAHAPQLSLADAQREKNDALCRKLRLVPSDHVLEIGTGWGGWSLHAARNYGCRVTTVTISQRQFELARQRVIDAGLAGRIDVQLCDFRDVRGHYDKIVSIEMMEALGHRYQATFAEFVARALKPNGLLALQFITCPDARYDEFRRGVDFIQKHIFPGSLLLSLNRVNDLLARAGGFTLHEMQDFGLDYARTLRLWRSAFAEKLEAVRALGFDERFLRKWTYYLCYCEAAFALRNISVVHTVHTRANNLSL